ncbi:hypothetical protein OHV05_04450 [Kitasatospora sp. NBC_00070]|uniref:hypothetical protein n=1 Tax=Kitasatospora sp. NBC_00070 TaxID=2975962 RepID=UPI00325654F1
MFPQVKVGFTVEVGVLSMSGLAVWRPCPKIDDAAGHAYVGTWAEVLTALQQIGRLVGPLVPAAGAYGYRVSVRHDLPSGIMLGLAEWTKSAETGNWLPALVWAAGDHGVAISNYTRAA